MRYPIFTLAAAASFVSAQTTSTPTGALIPVGEKCTPDGTPCALGANCYSTNSGLQTVCGNFQASCSNDEQCAFNTCNLEQGLCNGFLASSSASSSVVATVTSGINTPTNVGPQPAPSSTVVAPAGSLPLGADCNPYVTPSQCADGVQCWASNAMLMARCGNFNAECKTDAQCAYNTCNGGLCSGFKQSSSMDVMPAASTNHAEPSGSMAVVPPPYMVNGTMTVMPTGTGAVMPSGHATATSTGAVEFTGAASSDNVAGGVMAVVLGAVALAL